MKGIRKYLFPLIILFFLMAGYPSQALSLKDDGHIDLYEIFSKERDAIKTQVGSRFYKWSIHLPNDAIIYKTDRVNHFSMYSENYKTNISLDVVANKDAYSLEDILYEIQAKDSASPPNWQRLEKEYTSTINRDHRGYRYIQIIKVDPFYDYFLVDKAAEEYNSYIENRIYIANNFIYNLQVNMEGKYFRENPEMFEKLISSFVTSYDETKPYIKELSDSISEARVYKNTSYGWKITLNPYWKKEGMPNARNQYFKPVYTYDEINDLADDQRKKGGISVNLISSLSAAESLESWFKNELQLLERNYNPGIYKVIAINEINLGQLAAYRLKVKFRDKPHESYIVDTIYTVGNGYKYKIEANLPYEDYTNTESYQAYDNMLKSFRLTRDHSSYLGEILDASKLINEQDKRKLAIRDQDFEILLSKNWLIDQESTGDLAAYQSSNNLTLFVATNLDSRAFEDIIQDYLSPIFAQDEVRLGLAQIMVESANTKGINLCRISVVYDLDRVDKFSKDKEDLVYSYNSLLNQHIQIIQKDNVLYNQRISIPLTNTNSYTMEEINQVWEESKVYGIRIGSPKINWLNRVR